MCLSGPYSPKLPYTINALDVYKRLKPSWFSAHGCLMEIINNSLELNWLFIKSSFRDSLYVYHQQKHFKQSIHFQKTDITLSFRASLVSHRLNRYIRILFLTDSAKSL